MLVNLLPRVVRQTALIPVNRDAPQRFSGQHVGGGLPQRGCFRLVRLPVVGVGELPQPGAHPLSGGPALLIGAALPLPFVLDLLAGTLPRMRASIRPAGVPRFRSPAVTVRSCTPRSSAMSITRSRSRIER